MLIVHWGLLCFCFRSASAPPTTLSAIQQPVTESSLSKEEGQDLIESILRESDVKRVLDKLVQSVCDDKQQSEQEMIPGVNDSINDVTDDATIEEILSEVEPTAGILSRFLKKFLEVCLRR